MTARQPRTPQEAAMLDPMGLLSMPRLNMGGGLFGGGRRRPMAMRNSTAGASLPPQYTGTATPSPMVADPSAPPSIDQAPPPPADWQQTLGPELMSQLPKALARTSGRTRVANGDTTQPLEASPLMPAPPMRGGMIASGPKYPMPPGMFGQSAPTVGAAAMSDKIANRGAPMDANGPGKKGFDWRMLAGIIGDGLLGLNGQAPIYAQNMWKLRQDREQHNQRLAEQAQEWQYRNNQPDYATVGNRRFSYNPATGEAQTLYVAPSEAEDYAASLGAEPGTEEYETLVSDYVLRHSGPTATANAMLEEDNRQTNRIGLEGVRQQNRIGIEGVRQGNRMSLRGMPTYRDTHPRPSTGRAGGSGGGKGAPGGVREGQTATNPQTGAKVVYRGGKWVPAR